MSIFLTVKEQQLTSRKARNAVTTALLTTILGELQRGRDLGDPTDERVFSVVTATRNNILFIREKAGVDEKNTEELDVLDKLLALKPELATEADINAALDKIIADQPDEKMGVIMGKLKEVFGARHNGAIAINIVKNRLLPR